MHDAHIAAVTTPRLAATTRLIAAVTSPAH